MRSTPWPGLDFDPSRAESLLRSVAQEQLLIFVPAAYAQLDAEGWAALVTPRTENGETLPVLFWQDASDGNRIRGQILLDAFSGVNRGRGGAALLGGLQHGIMRSDLLGRLHLLLVEQIAGEATVTAYVLSQSDRSADFDLSWSAGGESEWPTPVQAGQIGLVESEAGFLPDIEILAPLPQNSALRARLQAPQTFIERAPFARQQTLTTWRYNGGSAPASAGEGYELSDARLVATPLTTLALLLDRLQQGDVNQASAYATRFDLLQRAFDLGLGEPADWLAFYLDGQNQPKFGDEVTQRIRFFDNAERSRSFDALFEVDAEGLHRVASFEPAPAYEGVDLVTPAPPRPWRPRPRPRPRS
ncbi:MAG: hypothetical protein HC802_12990 [Caldilineaceae bacterium]|nr:hypothetical protein [Caldilineaceae bacterium]